MNTGLGKQASALPWLGCPYLPEYIKQFRAKAKFYFEFVVNNVYIFSYLYEVSRKVLAWQLETEVCVGAGQSAEVHLGLPMSL